MKYLHLLSAVHDREETWLTVSLGSLGWMVGSYFFSLVLLAVCKLETSLNLKISGITYSSARKKWKKSDLSFASCAGADRRRSSFSHTFPHERWLGEFREIPTGGCTTVNKWKRFVVAPTTPSFYYIIFFRQTEWKQRPVLALKLLRPKGFMCFW